MEYQQSRGNLEGKRNQGNFVKNKHIRKKTHPIKSQCKSSKVVVKSAILKLEPLQQLLCIVKSQIALI